MFRNKSAWFSSSVPQASSDFWIRAGSLVMADFFLVALEGGTVAGWRTADYLFSEDATCPDTLRIFESKDYLWKKLTVFQSLFLSACEKRQSVKSVCIGHYVLPPVSVQDEVRNVTGRLIWEHEDKHSVAQGSSKSFSCQTEDEYNEGEVSRDERELSDTDSSENEAPLRDYLKEYPSSKMLTGYVSMDNLQKFSGDLYDFHPRCFQYSSCGAHMSVKIHKEKRMLKKKEK